MVLLSLIVILGYIGAPGEATRSNRNSFFPESKLTRYDVVIHTKITHKTCLHIPLANWGNINLNKGIKMEERAKYFKVSTFSFSISCPYKFRLMTKGLRG